MNLSTDLWTDETAKAEAFRAAIDEQTCLWIQSTLVLNALYPRLKEVLLDFHWNEDIGATTYAQFRQVRYDTKRDSSFTKFVNYWYERALDTGLVSERLILENLKSKLPVE